MKRPGVVAAVLGTGTDIGKTFVGSRVLTDLRRSGVTAVARKPAQSFEPGDVERGHTDAQVLGAAAGEAAVAVCPAHRWYPVAMAPPMAADALRLPAFQIADLVDELEWPDDTAIGLLEGAGGTSSPIAHDGDNIDFARAAAADVALLVADAGLGTIHAVRTAVLSLERGLPGVPVIAVLNRFAGTALHEANARWLREIYSLDVVTDASALAARLLPTAWRAG